MTSQPTLSALTPIHTLMDARTHARMHAHTHTHTPDPHGEGVDVLVHLVQEADGLNNHVVRSMNVELHLSTRVAVAQAKLSLGGCRSWQTYNNRTGGVDRLLLQLASQTTTTKQLLTTRLHQYAAHCMRYSIGNTESHGHSDSHVIDCSVHAEPQAQIPSTTQGGKAICNGYCMLP